MVWIRRGVGLLVLLVLLVAGVLGVYRQRVLPQTEGRIVLPGLQGELRIERDGHGIPTVRAGSVHDAYFGLGVVHAQDRLWQLETHRRIGAGRLLAAGRPVVIADCASGDEHQQDDDHTEPVTPARRPVVGGEQRGIGRLQVTHRRAFLSAAVSRANGGACWADGVQVYL